MNNTKYNKYSRKPRDKSAYCESIGVLVLRNLYPHSEFHAGTQRALPIHCRCTFVVLASASSGERTGDLSFVLRPSILFEGPRPSAFIGLRKARPRSPPSTLARHRRRPAPDVRLSDLAVRCESVNISGALYENVSHQGHQKRWHCRPRRHRKDATGVVVASHRGYVAAMGKSCGRNGGHRSGWGSKR